MKSSRQVVEPNGELDEPGPRERVIEATIELIEKQGYHATGLNEIIKESGSPKGSLYYYFPEGKEQITEEAIGCAGVKAAGRIRANLAEIDDPAEAIGKFIATMAHYVELSDFSAGGPLQTVALETTTSSARINQACRRAYDQFQEAFREKLAVGGYPEIQARELAVLITATIEGALVLSRTYHTGDPLRLVAAQLEAWLKTLVPAAKHSG